MVSVGQPVSGGAGDPQWVRHVGAFRERPFCRSRPFVLPMLLGVALARAWVRILSRCWQDRSVYDVSCHRSAQAIAAA